MIMRIVGGRVDREAARRAVLEALVDRQDDQLAGAAQPALHQDAGEIGLGAGIVAFIFGEDVADDGREGHHKLLEDRFRGGSYRSKARGTNA